MRHSGTKGNFDQFHCSTFFCKVGLNDIFLQITLQQSTCTYNYQKCILSYVSTAFSLFCLVYHPLVCRICLTSLFLTVGYCGISGRRYSSRAYRTRHKGWLHSLVRHLANTLAITLDKCTFTTIYFISPEFLSNEMVCDLTRRLLLRVHLSSLSNFDR